MSGPENNPFESRKNNYLNINKDITPLEIKEFFKSIDTEDKLEKAIFKSHEVDFTHPESRIAFYDESRSKEYELLKNKQEKSALLMGLKKGMTEEEVFNILDNKVKNTKDTKVFRSGLSHIDPRRDYQKVNKKLTDLEYEFQKSEFAEEIEKVTDGNLTRDMLFNDPDTYYTFFTNFQEKPYLEGVKNFYKFIKDNELKEPDLTPKYVFDTLVKKYNILIFHRYPPEILLDQVRNDKTQKPYMLLLSLSKDEPTAEDGSPEMLTDSSKAFYKTVYNQLKSNDMLLRIAEVDSNFDLKKILITLDKDYGEKNKISMVLVNGHGGPNGILVDPDTSIEKSKMYITSSHIKAGGQKYKKFFSDNLIVIYNTCNAGFREDENKKGKEIAQRTSDVLDCKVIAPDTGMAGIDQDSFKISRDKNTGHLECHIDYLKSHYSFSTTPNTVIYDKKKREVRA